MKKWKNKIFKIFTSVFRYLNQLGYFCMFWQGNAYRCQIFFCKLERMLLSSSLPFHRLGKLLSRKKLKSSWNSHCAHSQVAYALMQSCSKMLQRTLESTKQNEENTGIPTQAYLTEYSNTNIFPRDGKDICLRHMPLFSKNLFPQQQNGHDNGSYLIKMQWRLSKELSSKYLKSCLENN